MRSTPAVLLIVLVVLAFAPASQAQCVVDERLSGEILIQLAPGVDIQTVLDRYGLTLLGTLPRFDFYNTLVTPGDDADAIEELMDADDDVLMAEPHRVFESPEGVQISIPDLGFDFTSSDFRNQPATTTIHSDSAHTRYLGSGITIAVVDTGMSLVHPEYSHRLLSSGIDLAGGDGTAAAQANGQDEDQDGMIDESLHHATFVMGVINLVAPGARVIPIRALHAEGIGSSFALAQGIVYAVEVGADVINISESMLHESVAVEQAIEFADETGVVVVVAAGNRGLNIVDGNILDECQSFPAVMTEVISVAALDQNLVRASFSDYGMDVDLSAPGVDLVSTFGAADYALWSGTSFAAPMVSGAVALLLERYPGLTPIQVRDVLRQTTSPDNNPPELDGLMGAGVLDLDALTQVLTTDRTSLKLSNGAAGSALHWTPVLGAAEYDVARGDTVMLDRTDQLPEQVDLGPLRCVADNSVVTDTTTVPDRDVPAAGQVFFYVVRDDAPDPGGLSYGFASDGDPRIAGASDCPLAP